MGDQMTSEEKLLRLIRKKNAPAKEKKSAVKAGKNKKIHSSDGPDTLKLLRLLNRLLVIVILGIAAYIGARYIMGSRTESIVLDPDEGIVRDVSKRQQAASGELKPFDEYRDRFERRDIFQTPWEGDNGSMPVGETVAISDLSKRLVLVGIVLDDDPKAILEDLGNKTTLFMSVGESFENATLEEIQEGKVIFLYNNERVELTP